MIYTIRQFQPAWTLKPMSSCLEKSQWLYLFCTLAEETKKKTSYWFVHVTVVSLANENLHKQKSNNVRLERKLSLRLHKSHWWTHSRIKPVTTGMNKRGENTYTTNNHSNIVRYILLQYSFWHSSILTSTPNCFDFWVFRFLPVWGCLTFNDGTQSKALQYTVHRL